jgi:hypothetical protein
MRFEYLLLVLAESGTDYLTLAVASACISAGSVNTNEFRAQSGIAAAQNHSICS